MRFPGKILHVFDGGTWDDDRIGEIRLPPSEITAIDFVEPAQLPDLLSPPDARRALSAVRARINSAGTTLLENSHPLPPAFWTASAFCEPPPVLPPPLAPRTGPAQPHRHPGVGLAVRA
ncbi:hypothetical protein ACFY8O_34015 [Streptomyces argenteolus]|uniref:Uncharacterized protein n=1 Tax=Streptomyces argenteolus TaxID=67274 RepID=A0ABW6XGQ5_9ACTN